MPDCEMNIITLSYMVQNTFTGGTQEKENINMKNRNKIEIKQ